MTGAYFRYIFHLLMNRFYKIGFFILLFLLAAGTSFYIGTNLNKQPTDSVKATPSPTVVEEVVVETSPTPGGSTREYVEEQIEAAVTSKNYAALEGYMADNVFVILEATECCGSLTKAEATQQLDYLNAATAPWNFDQTNETIKKLKTEDPTDYGPESTYVGIASNEYVVAFKFDATNRINGVTMAVTYKLVVQ